MDGAVSSSDTFGAAVWDRWLFARSLGADRYPEPPSSPEDRAVADMAFFSGDFATAAQRYTALSAQHPGDTAILARLLHCHDAGCDWQSRGSVAERLSAALNETADINATEPLCYLSMPMTNAQCDAFARARNARYRATVAQAPAAPVAGLSADTRLTLGYLSIDFRAHSCGVPLWPILAGHDRDRFRIVAYSLAPADKRDEVARNVGSACDVFRDLGGISWRDAAAVIASDNVDILVDTTRNIRGAPTPLLQHRLAPLQISAWGYGGTSGNPMMDVILGDSTLIAADEDAFYTEKVVRLPAYLPLARPHDETPPTVSERAAFGLPPGAIVLAGFSNPYKLDEATFTAWLEILQRRPETVLWLTAGTAHSRSNLHAHASARGIGLDRLIFAGPADEATHARRFRHVDLVLDNPRLGSGSSAVFGLAAEVPAITVQGRAPAERGAECFLRGLGLTGFIAADRPGFVDLAAALAGDGAAMARARANVRRALCGNTATHPETFLHALESCYRHLAAAVSGIGGDANLLTPMNRLATT